MNRRRQRGSSLIEVLVATVLISGAALGLGTAILHLGIGHRKTVAASNVVALESALLSAVVNPNAYMVQDLNQFKSALAGGTLPETIILKLNLGSGPVTVPVTIKTSTPAVSLFAADLSSCSASDCPFKLTLQSRKNGSGQYQIAYALDVNQKLAAIPTIGGTKNSDGSLNFDNDSLIIPSEIYKTGYKNACDPASETAAIGMNKNTGEVNCIKKPNVTDPSQFCQLGYLPKYLTIFTDGTFAANGNQNFIAGFKDDPVNTSLGKACVKLKKIGCGPASNYVINNFDAKTIDGNFVGAVQGQCVYITQTRTAVKSYTGNNGAVSGTFCPPNYVIDTTLSSCIVIDGGGTAGACPAYIQVPSTTNTPTCAPLTTYTVQQSGTTPVPYATNFIPIFTVSGAQATCKASSPPQPCGAVWNPKVQLNIVCKLNPSIAETIGAVEQQP